MIKLKGKNIWVNPNFVSAIKFENCYYRNGGDAYIYVPGMDEITMSYDSYEEFYEDFKDILNESDKQDPLGNKEQELVKVYKCIDCKYYDRSTEQFPCNKCWNYSCWEEKSDERNGN